MNKLKRKLVLAFVLMSWGMGAKSQSLTFYMDSLRLERGNESMEYNRFNTRVFMSNEDIVKSVFLGVLEKDSMFLVLKQGLIQYNNKFVPVLLYSMKYTDKLSSETDSITGSFQMFSPRSSSESTITKDGFGKLFFVIKADSTSYRTLPRKPVTGNNKYDVIHKLSQVKIAKKTLKSTATSQTTGLPDNQFSKPYKITTYKKVDLFYTVSVHPIDNFPDIKLVCLSYRTEKDKPSSYSYPTTFLMKGKEGASADYSSGFFFFMTPGKAKSTMMRCQNSIFVSQKN
jgi:hypothetical protein